MDFGSDRRSPEVGGSVTIRSEQFLTEFQDTVLRQNSAEVSERINQRIATDDGTRADNCVTTDLCSIADDRPKFAQSGRNELGFRFHSYLLAIQSNIRKDNAGAEMDLVT
jgi:hypothetical protein